ELGMQDLHRDAPTVPPVVCEIHGRHAAAPELTLDRVGIPERSVEEVARSLFVGTHGLVEPSGQRYRPAPWSPAALRLPNPPSGSRRAGPSATGGARAWSTEREIERRRGRRSETLRCPKFFLCSISHSLRGGSSASSPRVAQLLPRRHGSGASGAA